MRTVRSLDRGFAMISAIFLLIAIAVLAAAAVTISTTQHRTSAQDLLGTQAYQAARTGIEWGLFNLLENPGGISCSTGGTSNAVAMPTGAGTLTPFTVNVVCAQFAAVTEGEGNVTMFQLTSTASLAGTAVGTSNYIERQISVTVAQ